MTIWEYAEMDDWMVLYKNGKAVHQHDPLRWEDVFDLLGVEITNLGYFHYDQFPDNFPNTSDELKSAIHVMEVNKMSAVEKEAEIVRLRAEINRLTGNQ